jgi:hypothetical protein
VPTDTDHFTVIGALLGSQTGRDVSIVNSFELVYTLDEKVVIDDEFFKDRREQCEWRLWHPPG